jgi:hypothetical protein
MTTRSSFSMSVALSNCGTVSLGHPEVAQACAEPPGKGQISSRGEPLPGLRKACLERACAIEGVSLRDRLC